MAAIEGGQAETARLIVAFQYSSNDPDRLDKSKHCKDEVGNSVLHHAYKTNDPTFPPIPKDYQLGKEDKRNRRGFLPQDLVHKKSKLDMQMANSSPDYLMVV